MTFDQTRNAFWMLSILLRLLAFRRTKQVVFAWYVALSLLYSLGEVLNCCAFGAWALAGENSLK